MVRRWFRERVRGWRSSAVMNAVGAIATAVVLAIVVWTKFALEAWMVVVTVPLLVYLFLSIRRHYQHVADRLSIQELAPRSYIPRPKGAIVTHPAVVIVGQLHRGTVEALDYARSIADEVIAVHVDIDNLFPENSSTRQKEPGGDNCALLLVRMKGRYES